MKGKGVVLLSGGMDSAVTAWIAKQECDELYALSLWYGQKHERELIYAEALALILGVKKWEKIGIDLFAIGGSSLVGEGEIPTKGNYVIDREATTLAISRTRNTRKAFVEALEEIPSTWVPQRNSIFLSIAFGWAEVVGANKVYIGVNIVDYSGYPDCRPEFIEAIGHALNLASKQYVEEGKEIEIEAPLSGLSKADIVKKGMELGVPFEHTTTCYRGEELACGECDSCKLRLKGFKEAGIKDPIRYKEGGDNGST